MPLTRETRVLSPADYALSHEASGNARAGFPIFDSFDGSYPFNYPYAKSVFFRKPGNSKPWSVCVDGHGRGLSHVSTRGLFGRKFFTWGTGRGGKRWMEFLSAGGKGDYIEIQGGVTPTQLQTCPLKAGTSIDGPSASARSQWMPRRRTTPTIPPRARLRAESFTSGCPRSDSGNGRVSDRTSCGAGAVAAPSRGRLGLAARKTDRRTISPGMKFAANSGEEEQPWAELLSAGTFSNDTLNKRPYSFNVSAGWADVTRESRGTAKRGCTISIWGSRKWKGELLRKRSRTLSHRWR